MKKYFTFILTLLILTMVFYGCCQDEIQDGIYTIEVTLTGGSGKASVESPTKIFIDEGQVTATIIWSSPFYEYMMIGETRFEPVQEKGNSTFRIPIVFNENISVSASTTAMSEPHVVEYTLYFDSKTLKEECS